MLRKTARAMLPFYEKIVRDRIYAIRWSRAVRRANLNEMIRLLKQVIPRFDIEDFGLAADSAGYAVDVPVPKPVELYTNGTSIPVFVQAHFNTNAHRAVARAILPLYRAIIKSQTFAKAIVQAFTRNQIHILNRLVRSKVKSPYLKKVDVVPFGFLMRFKTPFDKYPYDNSFFLNVPV